MDESDIRPESAPETCIESSFLGIIALELLFKHLCGELRDLLINPLPEDVEINVPAAMCTADVVLIKTYTHIRKNQEMHQLLLRLVAHYLCDVQNNGTKGTKLDKDVDAVRSKVRYSSGQAKIEQDLDPPPMSGAQATAKWFAQHYFEV